MSTFDFDEWAELYRRDPAAFEARRLALLESEFAREKARGGAGVQPARTLVDQLQRRLSGLGDLERAQTAFSWMAASVSQLGARLGQLSEALQALPQPGDPQVRAAGMPARAILGAPKPADRAIDVSSATRAAPLNPPQRPAGSGPSVARRRIGPQAEPPGRRPAADPGASDRIMPPAFRRHPPDPS
jgi:hypothetical protein